MTHYIFGPINSRRFGNSLGIDLSPEQKRCNFDCLYCELAPKAAMKTSDANFNVHEVISQLNTALALHDNIDVITLTANGEPTMYKDFALLVDELLSLPERKKLLVLSNSAHIGTPEVCQTLLKLDSVKLSLDAVSQDVFQKIDRPHPSISIENIKEGIRKFSRTFEGELLIEILFVEGINDTPEEIRRLNDFLVSIDLTRIDIGTIDRPPAYGVKAVSNEKLQEIAMQFSKKLPINIVYRKEQAQQKSYYTPEEILLTLDKRPLTVDDIEILFDETTMLHLQSLIKANKIVKVLENEQEFYILSKNLHKKRKNS